ncbi:hypothetical protein DRW03_30545 [Corallococcus sp. H22C18031201]|nr:hypothetical protein DRW03_30545 [Corallococcus sp. H22C18031201]
MTDFRAPPTPSCRSPKKDDAQSDFFSMLPQHLQAEGWIAVPRPFLLEDQHVLTDRQFLVLTAMLGRATKESPVWRPEPSVLAADLGLRAPAVSSSISKVVSLNLGIVRLEDGAVDATGFWTKYDGSQYARIPWVWLQVHAGLELENHRHARVLLLLAALWNPREDPQPFLSQRFLAKVLLIDRSNARRSLQHLPKWVSTAARSRARGYGLQGLIERLSELWTNITGIKPLAEAEEAPSLTLKTMVQPGMTFQALLEEDFRERLVEERLVPRAPSEGMPDLGRSLARRFAAGIEQAQIQAMAVAHPSAEPHSLSRHLFEEFGLPEILRRKSEKAQASQQREVQVPKDRAEFMARFKRLPA